MLITVQTDEAMSTTSLPDEVRGAFWIEDARGQQLMFADANDGQWRMTLASGLMFCPPSAEGGLDVLPHKASIFAIQGELCSWTVICRPSSDGDRTTRILGLTKNVMLSIGRDLACAIVYPSKYVSAHHANLEYADGKFYVSDQGSANGVFLNGWHLPNGLEAPLEVGDVISILGLRITIGNRLISLNCPEDSLVVQEGLGLVEYRPPASAQTQQQCAPRAFFYPSLRFPRAIKRKSFSVDAPPEAEHEDETPLMMRIGPSLAMVLASVMSACVSITFMLGRDGSALRAVPMLAMAFAMLMGSVLWPIINKRHQHKRHVKLEAGRKSAYAQYLGKIRSKLQKEAALQRGILFENRICPTDCMQIAALQDPRFMAKAPSHADFLEIRLGIGDVPLEVDLTMPADGFQIQEDGLRRALKEFANEPKMLKSVPLGLSLLDSPVVGIVGSRSFTSAFMRNVIVQICGLHSYMDVKLAILADEDAASDLEFAKRLPHLFATDKTARYFAASSEEAGVVGAVLLKALEARMQSGAAREGDASPHIVILCPSKEVYSKSKLVKEVCSLKGSHGFSVIACAQHVHELPAQCQAIVCEDGAGAYLLDRDDPTGTRTPILLDAAPNAEAATAFAQDACNARMDVADSAQRLPASLTFMQMMDSANVHHLNVDARWRKSNPSDSLAAPLGVDAAGELLMLDLHEDAHGPHGLIAGTTGSGKSELIITYVLSMALAFPPDEVAFVLIDYKGGGLAKAFCNDRFCLPHVAGTVTNLDGSNISRSLASIKSELRRRQSLFNQAREALGGDNVDIYKYLDAYRQGRVKEACPHLIVIADEFAELKQQQPEFMDELISASRIGRSLGVHLVLATQKPSGVVNDQIWSNSRFKIALKVADAADSNEVIKRSDAAQISLAGRFFMLVGYNEQFVQGQSGFSGAPYVEGAANESTQRQGVCWISNTGRPLLCVSPEDQGAPASSQSQIVAVSQHIASVAAARGVSAAPLWLPPIPKRISLAEIEQRFGKAQGADDLLCLTVGAFDDPSHQRQDALRLPLMEGGNAVIYGTAGSGAEMILHAMLFSCVSQCSPERLHAYLLDFGSQSLRQFANAPQVGDIAVMGDDERIRRFFAFMSDQIEARRKLMANGGKSALDGLPRILVVLNGMAAFLDAYPQHEESLLGLARESLQFGIRMVVVGESLSAVRMRMRSYFRQVLAVDLSDPADAVSLFGSLEGLTPPHGRGRGIVRIDDELFEFQAATICQEDADEQELLRAACSEAALKWQGVSGEKYVL